MSNESSAEVFFLVWRKDGSSPTRVHDSQHAAEKEAQRLARACPGSRFVVMASVCAFEVNDLTRIAYELEIPF
jgi:hypothetical protein